MPTSGFFMLTRTQSHPLTAVQLTPILTDVINAMCLMKVQNVLQKQLATIMPRDWSYSCIACEWCVVRILYPMFCASFCYAGSGDTSLFSPTVRNAIMIHCECKEARTQHWIAIKSYSSYSASGQRNYVYGLFQRYAFCVGQHSKANLTR